MDSHPANILLPASVTIDDVDGILIQIKELKLAGACVLDASQVNIITTPGAQLILSLERALNEKNHTISLVNPTENFRETFRVLGMKNKLSEWERSNG